MTDLDLSDLDQVAAYDAVAVPENDQKVPDGRYTTTVAKVTFKQTENGDRRLVWHLKILGPTHPGRMLFLSHGLDNAKCLPFLKRDLQMCGVTLTAWSQLPSRLGDLLDKVLEVSVKSRDDFQNIYLCKRVELAAGVTPADLMVKSADGSTPSISSTEEAPF